MIKKFFIFLLASLMLALSALPVSAAPEPPPLEDVRYAYLYCLESESVIVSKGSGEVIFPAATAKIMTGLLAAELLSGRLDQTVTVTHSMLTSAGGTSLPIRAGDSYTVRDLYYAAVLGGFNDAVSVIAHLAGEGTENFVALMNDRAAKIGAKNTHFTNPTGKHDENMVSTLADLTKIACEARKNTLYMEASSASTYTMSDGFTVRNRNGLIGTFYAAGYYNHRARGLVAGDSTENGFSLASIAEYDGLNYLVITFAEDYDAAYAAANALLDYGFYHYGPLTLIKAGDVITSAPLSLALAKGDEDVCMLDIIAPEDVTLYLTYDRNSLDTLEIKPYTLSDKLTAPVKEGEVVGGADIYIDGKLSGSIDLVAKESVSANPFLLVLSYAKDFFTGRAFIIALIIFLILFAVYYFTYEAKRRGARSKNYKIKNIY